MTRQDINEKYKAICTLLGDIDVKIQGLKNQRKELFKELTALDQLSAMLTVPADTKADPK